MSIHDGSLERLEELLGVYATDPDVDMDAAAVEMIERLTAEVAELEKDTIEYVRCDGGGDPGEILVHIITNDQIDAAWKIATQKTGPWAKFQDEIMGETEGACKVLSIFNIVACEECGGSGNWSSTSGAKCPSCKGHGWVKK